MQFQVAEGSLMLLGSMAAEALILFGERLMRLLWTLCTRGGPALQRLTSFKKFCGTPVFLIRDSWLGEL